MVSSTRAGRARPPEIPRARADRSDGATTTTSRGSRGGAGPAGLFLFRRSGAECRSPGRCGGSRRARPYASVRCPVLVKEGPLTVGLEYGLQVVIGIIALVAGAAVADL